MKLSFVIPCYRSEKTITMVLDEIADVMKERPDVEFEVVCVNDCSPDDVLQVLVGLADERSYLKVIDFMRNFGKDSAIMAGLTAIDGDIAIVMDDDFQCPTYEVWRLIEPLLSGESDISTALYEVKMESGIKQFGSNVQKFFAQRMIGQPKGIRIENFLAITKPVYEEMLNYKNAFPFLDGLMLRVSRRISCVPMKERKRGDDKETGFTIYKSVKMFVDGLTAFSVKPLRVATFLGFITACLGMLYLLYTVIFYFINPGIISEGYSSIMATLLFIGGMLMMMIGMVGEYIGRIYICINQSPQYVIRKTYNIDDNTTMVSR